MKKRYLKSIARHALSCSIMSYTASSLTYVLVTESQFVILCTTVIVYGITFTLVSLMEAHKEHREVERIKRVYMNYKFLSEHLIDNENDEMYDKVLSYAITNIDEYYDDIEFLYEFYENHNPFVTINDSMYAELVSDYECRALYHKYLALVSLLQMGKFNKITSQRYQIALTSFKTSELLGGY